MTAASDHVDPNTLVPISPRHLDFARALMQQIRNGKPGVGELLPTETELCVQWGLSRYAVRQAVQKLCMLGLVTRQAGVGTRVVSDRPLTRYVQAMDTLTDLVRYAQGTTLKKTSSKRIKVDERLSTMLRCTPGAAWLHIVGVRHVDSSSEPIALVDIYVDNAFSKLPRLKEALDVPVYTMIEEQYGIKVTRVEQELQGSLIEGEAAETLQVPDGSVGLRIIRTYYVRDQVIEVTTGLHPASRFSYSMTFQLAQSAGTRD